MFGLACEICWERNCSCNDTDRAKYNALKTVYSFTPNYTATEPKVCSSDIIIQNNEQFKIVKVENGLGYKTPFSNETCDNMTELKGEYLKLCPAIL